MFSGETGERYNHRTGGDTAMSTNQVINIPKNYVSIETNNVEKI